MTQEERQQKFNLFLEGFGVAPHVHIYTASSSPANISILELLASTGIALFFIYLFSSIWWVVAFIVIYWILNFIKYLSPFPDIPKATLRFDTDGIEKDKKYFWAWEDIQKESVGQDHPNRKRSILDNFPPLYFILIFIILLIPSIIAQTDLTFGLPQSAHHKYYYFSFETPQGVQYFILEEEEISQHKILQDYFEKYRIYHKIKKETFQL
ncbi:MAG: hypothetical protein MUC49_07790 [Raineya sp.]|jgi:hypothetical protein|nr:hypothetical protein [Raineya sp.]